MKRPLAIVGLQLLSLALIMWGVPAKGDDAISLSTLLNEMINRDHLARLPQPAYTCRQASSYDRRATSPDKKETWFANGDASQFIRTEEHDGHKEFVMMDAEGPGAVVRIWSTWNGARGGEFSNGTLRIYLDGNKKPTLEGHIADVLDGGALTGPPLSESVSPLTPYRYRGHNLYLPLPYAKHCKITYSTKALNDQGTGLNEALYYQIVYRTYDKTIKVKPFSTAELEANKALIARVQKQLLHPEAPSNAESMQRDGTLGAGESEDIAIDGPGAIAALSIRLNVSEEDREQALRSTVFEATFDGERTVWCPIGDFFGLGRKFVPYKTWYTEVTEDGKMTCFWIMPYEKECRLTVHNLSSKAIDVAGEVKTIPWKWDDRSMHFHSTWHQLSDAKTQTNKGADGGAFDVNYVTVKGPGVYVGDTLTIFNGKTGWWGEGDEKIFVDGESFPSHFGTGSEDYYGYAWSNPNMFASPFHAQPYGQGANHVDTATNSRYRELDAIPFTKSIKFDMELWHSQATTVDYAPATFFYAVPGATVNVQPDPEAAKLPVKQAVATVSFRIPGVLEGEDLKVVSKTGGQAETQSGADFHWSGDSQLWWLDGNVGDKLAIEFKVKKAGRYKVTANLTKAADYGIVQISVNGQKVTKKLDRYHTSVANDSIDLGTFELKQGANRLDVEIVGCNEKAIKRYMFGIDYLKLEAVAD